MGKIIIFGSVVGLILLILALTGTTLTQPPIELSFRKSLLVEGKVLRVSNTSSKESLECTMQTSSPKTNEKCTYSFRLRPLQTYEIGVLETNWTFISNESVTVKATGYALPVSCTVP